MVVRLGEDGDMSVLVIDENIGVATATSKNVAIMVNGPDQTASSTPRGWRPIPRLQQRLLGVGVVGVHAEPELDIWRRRCSAEGRPAPPRNM